MHTNHSPTRERTALGNSTVCHVPIIGYEHLENPGNIKMTHINRLIKLWERMQKRVFTKMFKLQSYITEELRFDLNLIFLRFYQQKKTCFHLKLEGRDIIFCSCMAPKGEHWTVMPYIVSTEIFERHKLDFEFAHEDLKSFRVEHESSFIETSVLTSVSL